jgi:phosphatidylserine/phosphatidylglycerophosphate/cardiolipin synthase-like enzyme
MPISYTAPLTTFFLPDERDPALAAMLAAVNAATSRFRGMFFNFSLPPLVDAVAATHTRGLDSRIILDHSQAATPSGVLGLHRLLLTGYPPDAVRIGTSPIHKAFQHRKNAVCDSSIVIQGSTNWSASGFEEENELSILTSPMVAAAYEAHFDKLWAWISANEPTYQEKVA